MTWTIKSVKVGKHSIDIYQEKDCPAYIVGDYEDVGCELLTTRSELYYPTLEKAKKRMSYLVCKYKREENR